MKKFLGTLLVLCLMTFTAVPMARAEGGYKTTQAFTLTVAAPLTISNAAALPEAVAGQAYTVTFTAAGGIAPYVWSVATGSTLPAGLTLTAAGVLSGTPTTAGSYSFSITVTDGIQTTTLEIKSPPRK